MEPETQEYVMNRENYSIREFNDILSQTFTRMFIGLLITAVTAYVVATTKLIIAVANAWPVLAIAEIVLVIVFSLGFKKLSPGAVTVMFYAYALLNGATLSVIFIVYQIGLIAKAFLITALMFGILAYYGHTTEKDLSGLGTILSVALIAGIIATIVNLFLKSDMFSIALDWIMLFIFCGLTMYDMNKMKAMSYSLEGGADATKLYVYCAMQLYLDFINIFLRILSIMGRRRN